jgi:hypothetical protein
MDGSHGGEAASEAGRATNASGVITSLWGNVFRVVLLVHLWDIIWVVLLVRLVILRIRVDFVGIEPVTGHASCSSS